MARIMSIFDKSSKCSLKNMFDPPEKTFPQIQFNNTKKGIFAAGGRAERWMEMSYNNTEQVIAAKRSSSHLRISATM